MCGIAGEYRVDGGRPARGERNFNVLDALSRRGPDASGTWGDDTCAFFHARLSILDLDARSDQPMISNDGRHVLAYNGEIYNFRAVRAQLERSGIRFTTEGDSEVLLAQFIQHGCLGLASLRGMFAFAIYDRETKRLTLGRDPFGIKPLVWKREGPSVLFASTSDALLELGIERRLNADFLVDYLRFGHGVLGSSPLAGVERVRPGTCLEFSGDESREWRYFDVRADVGESSVGEGEAFAAIRESILRHMVADVPVGVFLSGGIDSAAVAATMREAAQQVKSFSIGFPQRGFDESEAAAEVAARVGTEHTSITFTTADVPKLYDNFIEAYDEPIGDPAALPTLALSDVASNEVKVVLSGEGGDELFGGYRRYFLHHRLASVPGPLRRVAAGAARVRSERLSRLLGWRGFAEGYVRWLEFGPVESPEGNRDKYARELTRIMARQGPANRLWSLMLLDQVGWLTDAYLVKLDRATMFHSLEGRVPLLDCDVFGIAQRLSDRQRTTGPRVGKNLLRAYAARYLGEEYVQRPKHGFAVPLQAVFASGTLDERLRDERRQSSSEWARRLAGAARSLSTGGPTDANGAWYLLVLLDWCERRGLLDELDVLDTVSPPPRLKAGMI
jgi:asparagine synthase (glutamine-hydrolysing)